MNYKTSQSIESKSRYIRDKFFHNSLNNHENLLKLYDELSIKIEISKNLIVESQLIFNEDKNIFIATFKKEPSTFDLAHLLGHMLLHLNENQLDLFKDSIFYCDDIKSQYGFNIDIEANEFAATLLMPEDVLKNYITNKSQNINDIANHFNVTNQAVINRMKMINYHAYLI